MQIKCLLICITAASLTAITACGGRSEENKWTTIGASPTPSGKTVKDMDTAAKGSFVSNLPSDFEQPASDVGKRLLKEYGAVFIARGGATPPNKVVFHDAADVAAFQSKAGSETASVGGVSIELQAAAMKALKEAVEEAKSSGVSITPRGSDAAKRSYEDTVGLWKSRVDPGLEHWTKLGRLSSADASRIRALSPFDQVPEIFKLEDDGMYFAKDLSKSIIYSVAPPGTSQHLSMLALDVTENEDSKVRSILAKHGWFQTVATDLPHFTFLGVSEADLNGLGLKKTVSGSRSFYIPDL